MEALSDMIRQIIIIILLAVFLDMLLPSGGMQRFVKAVMGLFILVTILAPILDLLMDEHNLQALSWDQDESVDYVSVLQDNSRLAEVNEDLLEKNYALRLSKQMEAIANMTKGVSSSSVAVEFESGKDYRLSENVCSVLVTVLPEQGDQNAISIVDIEMIDIGTKRQKNPLGREANSAAEKETAMQIKKALTQYFNINTNKIKVLF